MSSTSVNYDAIVEQMVANQPDTFFNPQNKQKLVQKLREQYPNENPNEFSRAVNTFFVKRRKLSGNSSANHSAKISASDRDETLSPNSERTTSRRTSRTKSSTQNDSRTKTTRSSTLTDSTRSKTKDSHLSDEQNLDQPSDSINQKKSSSSEGEPSKRTKRRVSIKAHADIINDYNISFELEDGFNVIADSHEENYFVDAKDVLKSLISSETYDKFIKLLDVAIEEHNEVVEDHLKQLKTPRGNKSSPKITYSKVSRSCKIGPKDKTDDCPNLLKLFQFIDEIKPQEQDDFDYLQSPVVRSHNIIDLGILKTVFETELNCNIIPNLDYFHTDSEFREVDARQSSNYYDTNYASLFIDIQDVKGKTLSTVVKKIYSHRAVLVNRIDANTAYKRIELWNAATANMLALKSTVRVNDYASKIIDCWINILKSRYAFYVILYGVKSNKTFDKAFNRLISDELSIRMFAGPLYPISFAFTPFMLYGDGQLKGDLFEALQSSKYSEIKPLNWIYYLKHAMQTNAMLEFCGKYIWPYNDEECKEKVTRPRASKTTKSSSKRGSKVEDVTKGFTDQDIDDVVVDDDVFDQDGEPGDDENEYEEQ